MTKETNRPGGAWTLSSYEIVNRVIAVAALLFLFLPILIIIPVSFSATSTIIFPPPGLSLRWYQLLMERPEWAASLWLSLKVAAIATVIATLLGILAALALVRSRFRGKTAAYVVLLAPMIVPAVLTAIAIYFLFAPLKMVGSTWAIGIGSSVVLVPLTTMIISATLQGFDERLEQAAISLGASPVQAFLRITLPIIAPGVASAAVFAFLNGFNELMVPLFLASPTVWTLSVRMWNSVLIDIEPTVAAVSTLLIVTEVALLAIVALLRRAQSRLKSTYRPT